MIENKIKNTELRELREEFGLKQWQLAKMLCVTKQTLHRWESDIKYKNKYNLKTLRFFLKNRDDPTIIMEGPTYRGKTRLLITAKGFLQLYEMMMNESGESKQKERAKKTAEGMITFYEKFYPELLQ